MTTAERAVPGRPEGAGAVGRTQDHLFAFLVALRAEGLNPPVVKQLDFFAGIEALGPSTTGQLYWVGVTTLVTSEAGRAVFDDVFGRFFGSTADALVVEDVAGDDDVEDQDDEDEEQVATAGENDVDDVIVEEADGGGLLASQVSPENPRVFGATDLPSRELMRLICEALPAALPTTRARRQRPGARRHRVDLRATCREARRTDGEIVQLRWRHRPPRERRVLLLIDVSGSMKQFSPDYLRFAHTVVSTCGRAEVFTFGTRLTRVTAALRARDVDAALGSLSQVVLDADGGTQIGVSLQDFLGNAHFVTMARGALVLVLSDGLERGDCAAMTAATRRLGHLAHQLAWWSPLACDPDYRPLTRGMAAILDDLDALTGVRDLETALTAVRHGFPREHTTPTGKESHA